MPDRTISVLAASCGALIALYIGLVVTTVSYAAWQTDLAAAMRNTDANIASLESQYYAQVARLDSVDPASIGLVTPSSVKYAVMVSGPTLTLR